MFRALSEIPVPTAAQFVNDKVIQLDTSVRDNSRDIKRSLSSFIFLQSRFAQATPASDVGDAVASIPAALGTASCPRRAVLRETKEKKRFVEMWIGDVLEVSKDVTDMHGSFYSDEIISTFAFSPSELAFMYVGERNEPHAESEKFKFAPHLGEGIGGPSKKRPTIFIFRWDPSVVPCISSVVSVQPKTDDQVLFGQAVFSPIDKGTIYATGYELTGDGRLLGARWCANRPSGVLEIKLAKSEADEDSSSLTTSPHIISSRKLTPPDLSCRSPCIYQDATTGKARLYYLAHASGGPHAGTFALHARDPALSEAPAQVLVDTVWEPRPADGFPGLYPDARLPASPFVTLDGEVFLVFSSSWRSRTTVLCVSGVDGRVVNLTPDVDGKLYSYAVLNTNGWSRVVCSRSAPAIPHEIVVGDITREKGMAPVASWRVVYSPEIPPAVHIALSRLEYSVMPIPGRGKTETIILKPNAADSSERAAPPPCIQSIHGGPHSVSTTEFSPFIASLSIEGYTVSMPNYTGSTGFGETSVRALLGRCGTLDVQDCIATARHLVSLGVSVEGKGKQFVVGGSHGGFLSAHLIGQFPDFFTAAILRNPVISASPMSSDIPDWYFNEFGVEYPMYSAPTAGQPQLDLDARLQVVPPRFTPALFQRLFPASPMAYVDAVRAHILLNLGGSDARVTPIHGLEYYHALKGNAELRSEGQEVEMHWFEDQGHSLDGVQVSRVVGEMAVAWLNRYRA